MKQTRPDAFLSRTLLCFVRDERPTVDQFIERFGGQTYHILRKNKIIVVEEERLRLNRKHLSPDRMRFVWGFRVIHLDNDEVELVRWGPDGPPIWSALP